MKLRLHNVHGTMMFLVVNGMFNQFPKYTHISKLHESTRVMPLCILAKHGLDKIFKIDEGEG